MERYRSLDEYKQLSDSLRCVCGIVLFSLSQSELNKKDIILRNFLAKSSMSLNGIFSLWEIGAYQDCWCIYRILLDRLFHIEHLEKTKTFQEFDDWSIYEQAAVHNLAKSDKRFPSEDTGKVYYADPSVKIRMKGILKEKPSWRRPNAQDVAKSMGMDFLYKFGYNTASMHIHPMSNDGQEDFYTITKIPSPVDFPTQISVIHNAILIVTMVLQNVVNYSSYRWMAILWDYLDGVRHAIEYGDNTYVGCFLKISDLFSNQIRICEPIEI